jgi:hypothetical protein
MVARRRRRDVETPVDIRTDSGYGLPGLGHVIFRIVIRSPLANGSDARNMSITRWSSRHAM